MELGPGLATGCRPASGDINDSNKTECRALNGLMCNFTLGVVINQTIDGVQLGSGDVSSGFSLDRCIFLPGFDKIQMAYTCYTNYFDPETGEDLSSFSSCPNNCRGVDANDIIAGGAAVLFVASTAATSALTPGVAALFGIGGLTVAGLGMSRVACTGPLYCTTSQGTCCLLVFDAGRGSLVCPSTC